MKRLLASLALIAATATLSGCYYDPGYSYVRNTGYNGDAYYGQAAPVYDGGYYAAPGYYDGYYGGYGCCYAPGVSIGISSGWYGGSGYRHYRGGGGYYHGDYHGGYRGHSGHWQGRSSSGGGHTRGGRSHGGHSGDHHDHRH